MNLASYTQQPADRLDYDIPVDLSEGDTVNAATVAVTPTGLTVVAVTTDDTVKLWVEDGVAGTVYKAEVTITTALGRTRQVELRFRIKDY